MCVSVLGWEVEGVRRGKDRNSERIEIEIEKEGGW